MAKVLYYQTKSKGKCGCAHTALWRSDCFETKAQLKRVRKFCGVFEWVLTEEQVLEKYGKERLEWLEKNAQKW